MKRKIYYILAVIFLTVAFPVRAQEMSPQAGMSPQTPISPEGPEIVLDVLDLKNMDVLDVLKLISQKSGINIVATANVKGRVTIYLKNIEVQQALKIIVEAYSWAFAREGDVIKVMTANEFEERYNRKFGQTLQQTKIQQLLFTTAADALAVLNQIKSTDGKIVADEKTNTLILIDVPTKIDEMSKIIERIDVPTESEVFDLSYAKAEEISGKIAETLTPTTGRMRFDERSNRIIINDTPQKIEEVAKIISAFDEKDQEVLIEAKIVQVGLSDEYKLGIDWEALVPEYHGLDIISDFDVLGETEKRGRVTIGTIDDDRYQATLDALSTLGYTDILSSPSITAVNNQEAKILVGSSEPYVTSTTTTPSSGPTTTSESVQFIEVGVKLFVTPTVHEDEFITMKIKPEVSSVTSTVTTGNNNIIPVVETSEAETTVLVKNGVTLVIGGLIKEEKLKTTKKIPFLGDIPVLKHAFQNVTDNVSKTEIVIFLKPTIITGDVENSLALDEYINY
ncbi:MAG: type II secretion system protein GspD [Candidatus Omnitrophica bacterium]|nr:type II secretion system protein GspD [Candidatus Omnitrophota bacterium]